MDRGKRYLAAILISTVMVISAPVTYAEDSLEPEVSILDITEDTYQSFHDEYIPTNVWMEKEEDFRLLKKTFLVEPDISPSELIEQNVMRHGVTYQFLEMYKTELPGSTETKTVSQKETIATSTKDQNTIAAQAEQTISYEQDGFSGTLTLDTAGITTEESGRQSYSYTINDSREYTGLASNDPYLVPKEVNKNGATLSLQDIQWTPTGVKPDGSGLPASYTATASYSGKGWGSKVTGYTATLPYSGEVTKEIPGKVQYTLVYEEIPPEPEEISEKQNEGVSPLLVSGGIALVAAAGFTGWNLHGLKKEKEQK